MAGENEQLVRLEVAVASAELDLRRRLRRIEGMGAAGEF
jgi:hypothetical protein